MINVTNAAVAGYKVGLVGEISGQFPTSVVHVCSQKASLLQLEATLTFTLPLVGRPALSLVQWGGQKDARSVYYGKKESVEPFKKCRGIYLPNILKWWLNRYILIKIIFLEHNQGCSVSKVESGCQHLSMSFNIFKSIHWINPRRSPKIVFQLQSKCIYILKVDSFAEQTLWTPWLCTPSHIERYSTWIKCFIQQNKQFLNIFQMAVTFPHRPQGLIQHDL